MVLLNRTKRIIGIGVLLSGCSSNLLYDPHTVEYHSEAGSFTVAATMVDSWDNFVEELSPGFKLLEATALEQAIPRSAITERQMLDRLGAALKLAPATTGVSDTLQRNTDAEGQFTQTQDESRTRESGDLSSVTTEQVPDAGLQQQGATKLPTSDTETSIDPFLRFTAASALYQEVKLLNKAVRSAARRNNMVPYILRLQLNNVPSARHQPYDTYALISMFSRQVCMRKTSADFSKCPGVRPGFDNMGWVDKQAVVVPLLVTDNLESQLSSRSSNTVRQIAMAASILQSGFAASLGLTRKTEELNAVLSNDLNSIMTVGQPSSSSLHVRLGAMLEATAQYAMVPRNYSVTILVLVPEDEPPHDGKIGKGDIEGLRITGTLTYRHVETGESLPRMRPKDRDDLTRLIVKNLGHEQELDTKRAQHLRVATYVNDYAWFRRILANTDDRYGAGQTAITAAPAGDIWNTLLENNMFTGYFGTDVHLPKSEPPSLPPKQTLVMIDDGKVAMKGSLGGSYKLGTNKLLATLNVKVASNKKMTLSATSVASDSKGNVNIQFPSLAAYGIAPVGTGEKPLFLDKGSLTLQLVDSNEYQRNAPERIQAYDVAYLIKSKPAPKKVATFSVSKAATAVIADKEKTGNIRLHVDFKKVLDSAKGDFAEISVSGADLTAATGAKVAAGVTLGKAKATGSGTVSLALANLISNSKIKITATGKNAAGKPKGGKHVIEVEVR